MGTKQLEFWLQSMEAIIMVSLIVRLTLAAIFPDKVTVKRKKRWDSTNQSY